MAPQSTIRNGRSARGPRRSSSIATNSLPVPLSPSSSTVASLPETFSSTPNKRRMSRDSPYSSPKDDHCGTEATAPGPSSRTRTTESPSSMWQSGKGRSASRTRTPSRRVPFSDPLSDIVQPLSPRASRQWNRDTSGSDRTRSLLECEPSRNRSPSSTTERWLCCPASRSTTNSSRGITTAVVKPPLSVGRVPPPAPELPALSAGLIASILRQPGRTAPPEKNRGLEAATAVYRQQQSGAQRIAS